jgi:hypothetical protein
MFPFRMIQTQAILNKQKILKDKNILLIGNSIISYNKLPQLLEHFIGDGTRVIDLSLNLSSIGTHVNRDIVIHHLRDQRVEKIVFQPQALELSYDNNYISTFVNPAIRAMMSSTRVQCYLYQTHSYCYGNGFEDSFKCMTQRIHNGSEYISRQCHIPIIPINDKWYYLCKKISNYQHLYLKERNFVHQSSQGTFFSALVLYKQLYYNRSLPVYHKSYQKRWGVSQETFNLFINNI